MADYFHEMSWQPLGEGQQPDHLLHLARLFRDYNMFEELGATNRLPPPASKEIVQNLPTIDVAEGILFPCVVRNCVCFSFVCRFVVSNLFKRN